MFDLTDLLSRRNSTWGNDVTLSDWLGDVFNASFEYEDANLSLLGFTPDEIEFVIDCAHRGE